MPVSDSKITDFWLKIEQNAGYEILWSVDKILPYFGKNMKFGNKKVTNCNLWKPDFYQTYKILLSRGKACKRKTTRY